MRMVRVIYDCGANNVVVLTLCILMAYGGSGCSLLNQSSKYNFNDGIYQTKRLPNANRVYVLNVDEDTIAVFPVLQFKDSTAILTKKRINYTSDQRKMKDSKVKYCFYKHAMDIDIITVAAKYRPATALLPNQLTTNFNGAPYLGYRIDEYCLNYKKTPLNAYKQSVKHIGYSAGIFAGLGNTLIDQSTMDINNFLLQYEGVLFVTGIAANVAIGKLSFGLSGGVDYLMDKYHAIWTYEGKPSLGLTVGIDLE